MRFLPKWVRRLVMIAGLLCALVIVLYFTVLPSFVRARIRSGLRTMGVNDSAFELREVTLGGLELVNVDLGRPQWLHIARIDATYSLASLVSGRIKKIEVDDAQWRVRIKDGRIDFGPTLTPGSASTAPMDAAFDQLVIRRATLTIENGGRTWPVPVDGTVTRAAPGKIALALTLNPLGDAAQLSAVLAESSGLLSLDGSWRISGRVPDELLQLLRDHGVEIHQPGAVALSGQMTATLGSGPDRAWQINLPAVHATIEKSDLVLTHPLLSLSGVRADLNLRAFIDHQGISIFLQDGGDGSIEQVHAGPENEGIDSTDKIELAFDSSGNQLMAQILFGGDALLNVGAHSTKVVALRRSNLEATSESMAIKAAIALPKGGEPASSAAQLEFSQATINSAGLGLALKGVSGSIPIVANREPPQPGQFAIQSIMWNDAALPALTGSISMNNQRIEASANWPLFQEVNVAATAWVDLSGQSPSGDLTATIPQFQFAQADSLAKLFPALAQTRVGGSYALSANVQLENGQFKPLVKLTAQDASIENPTWSAGVQSAGGTITINSFAPLSTLPDQQITIGKARIGKLDVQGGSVALTVEKPDSILIQAADWSMGDYGKFRSGPFRFDPRQPRLAMQLTCEDVGLGSWLDLLTSGKIKGEGRLGGELALTYVPQARKKILIGEGSLSARSSAGWVQTNDSEGLVQQIIQSNPELGADERLTEVKQRIIGALMDFQYSQFQLDFVPQPDGGTTCVITTKGAARTGSNPQEIGGLTINVNHFDDRLNQVILLLSAMNRLGE